MYAFLWVFRSPPFPFTVMEVSRRLCVGELELAVALLIFCDGLHHGDLSVHRIMIMQTVAENEKGYSKRQLTDAKTARDLYAKVGYPSIKDFSNMIKKNMIMNSPVII